MTGEWPKRQLRHAVQLDAQVLQSSGEAINTGVVDVSLDGCKLVGEFPIGERINVRIQRLDLFLAVVRWSLGDRSGARFVRESEVG